MTQKELNYVEDFYNHELLIKEILLNSFENIENEKFSELLNDQITKHEKILKGIMKLLEVEC